MTGFRSFHCSQVDDLAASYALGAMEPEEERAISSHLTSCTEAHNEARASIEGAAALTTVLDPVAPSAALRARVMGTVARTPQDHRLHTAPVAESNRRAASTQRRAWWQVGPLPSAIAAVGLAAAGTFTETGVTHVPLERSLEGAALFAVTVERERVEQPTTDPVLVAEIGA